MGCSAIIALSAWFPSLIDQGKGACPPDWRQSPGETNPKGQSNFNVKHHPKSSTYLEQELKFFGIRPRTDPTDIEANGKYAHDLGFILVDRDFKVIGKWPLADARSEQGQKLDPTLYPKLKQELFDRIRLELSKK